MRHFVLNISLFIATLLSYGLNAQHLLKALEANIADNSPEREFPMRIGYNNWVCAPTRLTVRVTLITPYGTYTYDQPSDERIIDAAEEYGIDLPFSDRAGSTSSEAAFVLNGWVNQMDQVYIPDEILDRGWILTNGYPCTDVTIITHLESELNSAISYYYENGHF